MTSPHRCQFVASKRIVDGTRKQSAHGTHDSPNGGKDWSLLR